VKSGLDHERAGGGHASRKASTSCTLWATATSPMEIARAFDDMEAALGPRYLSLGCSPWPQSVHEVEAFLEGVAAAGALGVKPLFTFLCGGGDQFAPFNPG